MYLNEGSYRLLYKFMLHELTAIVIMFYNLVDTEECRGFRTIFHWYRSQAFCSEFAQSLGWLSWSCIFWIFLSWVLLACTHRLRYQIKNAICGFLFPSLPKKWMRLFKPHLALAPHLWRPEHQIEMNTFLTEVTDPEDISNIVCT